MYKELAVYEIYETENVGQVILSTDNNIYINCQLFAPDAVHKKITDYDLRYRARILQITGEGTIEICKYLPKFVNRVWKDDDHKKFCWKWTQGLHWANSSELSPLKKILKNYYIGEINPETHITVGMINLTLNRMERIERERMINNIVDASPYSTKETVRNKMLKDNNYLIYIILDLAYEWNELRG